jgi:AcrR family transcriptional regulator
MHEIARRADVHTPQLSYHFTNKRGLWEAAVVSLLDELDRRIEEAASPNDAESTLRGLIRVFVHFAAEHPDLNRIIVAESAESSERLDWLVENHTRRRYRAFVALVEPLQREGAVHPIPPTSLYYLLVGGASLPFSAAPEAKRFSGQDPGDPAFIEAHAAALERMLFTR